jgi:hypothetical protein
MVKGIGIYIEGGAPGKEATSRFREGFRSFFAELIDEARDKKLKWKIIPSGSRSEAYKDFVKALEDHTDWFNVLLVDSEGPILYPFDPKNHLKRQDGWDLSMCDDKHCHLMTQMMEAWFIADRKALARFYGSGFNENALPNNPDVERVPKSDVERALANATRNVPKRGAKGPYRKGSHAPKLLKEIDSVKVRNAASFCQRLFTTILREINESA